MRIWLDPAKLNNFALTPGDVSAALQAQNVQVASGEIGGLPSTPGQRLNATIIGPQRLQSADEFGRILLKVNTNGSQVLLRDVARISLGAESYAIASKYNGLPAAGLAIKLAPGSNALDTAKAIHSTLDQLKPFFPPGLEAAYPFDTTPFVRVSIEAVVKTLLEAIVLVFIVMYVFLQNFRATLIPTIAVPVVLLGTFGVLAITGFSINTLTMFAMVLAIGLLVDDAIVVVENVERLMAEEKLSPQDAARKSMGQISGALIGIGLVLTAVFLPMAFFSGSTGVIYRQFSITIVSAMVLSVMVALIFTPALCATLLKPPKGGEREHHGGVFGWFNRGFDSMNRGYTRGIGHVTKRTGRYLLVYLTIVIAMGFLFVIIPRSFLPDEDQGVLFVQVVAPPGTAAESTEKILDQIREYFLNDEKAAVNSVFSISGFSFGGRRGSYAVQAEEATRRRQRGSRACTAKRSCAGRRIGMKRALPIIIAKLAIVVLAALSACTMEPHYERPAAPVPAAWTGRLEVGNAESVTDIGWRQFFPDQNVQRLIELSLANNRDLRIAALNVQAAQAQYRIQRADLFPTVAVSGTEQVQKLPAGAVAPSAQGASTPTNGGTGSVPSNGHITRFYDVRNRLESRGHSRVRDACDSCGNVGRYVAIERPGDLVGLQPCAFAPGIVAEKPVTLTC